MRQFSRYIETLISQNRLEEGVEYLLNTLSDAEAQTGSSSEFEDIRREAIGISQRLHQIKDAGKRGKMDTDDIFRERTYVGNLLWETVGQIQNYPMLEEFIKEKEEDAAWEQATSANTIVAYQDYFNKYPEGKYKAETKAIIQELQKIEQEKSEQIKAAAAAERYRREHLQKNKPQRKPAPNPPHSRPMGMGKQSSPQSNEDSQDFDKTIAIVVYILTVFLPIIGLGVGLYIYVAKENGLPKYNAVARKKANIMFIIGGIMTLINLINMGTGGYNPYYY